MIDLFENPKALLAANFNPFSCTILGISLGGPASQVEGWETEDDEFGWSHLHGGVAFRTREGFVYQIKLPDTFFERLEVPSADELIRILGPYDDTRNVTYHDKLRHRGYLWNRGILAWWSILPKLEFSHLVIFDPRHGVPQDSENVTFSLDSGEECHREAPETFELPSWQRRENLVEGDLVKLMFRFIINGNEFVERMWTKVTEVRPDSYAGLLDNDPYCTNRIRAGMRVEFQAHHVIQIWTPPT